MIFTLAFPAIDPVLLQIGPLAIRWYALAYVVGLVLGWRYIRYFVQRQDSGVSLRDADDLLIWCTLGVVLGGRLGYVLFYQPGYFIEHPGQIPLLWQGGMSFHGGALGVLVAAAIFSRLKGISLLSIGDAICCAAPIGLFFGRIANFINGELYGRPSDVSWAMVFPTGGPEPRHPSQLYEAILEGLVVFTLLAMLTYRTRAIKQPGLLAGVFFSDYAVSRIIVELFREPDPFLGFLVAGVTMGQLLSLPVLVFGIFLIVQGRRRTPAGA